MNVLVLTSRLPFPPDRGDRLLALRMLEVLASRHRVTLASFVNGREPQEGLDRIRALGIDLHVVRLPAVLSLARTALALPTRTPLQIAYYRSGRMNRLVDGLTASCAFDATIVQMIRMTPYGLRVPTGRRIAFLADSYGLSMGRRAAVESGVRSAITRLEAGRIARYEQGIAERYDRTWLVSPADLAGFPRTSWPRIDIVPNGFSEHLLQVGIEREPGARLLFVGHLGVPHNVDSARVLAREVLPAIRARRPDATLRLVGADPAPEVRALHAPPGVVVTGFVPDLAAEFALAHAFVAPLRFAAGVQNKIIESLAAGVPVVTSSIAADGLGATGGRDLLVADEPAAMAACVADLLADESGRAALGLRGREFAARGFRWSNILAALERADSMAPVVQPIDQISGI